jgi:DNA transposition AAA+ family ATPase
VKEQGNDLQGLREYMEGVMSRRPTLDFSRVDDDRLLRDFRQTRTFDQILWAITTGQRIAANLVLITGQNGGGKTTALKLFAATTHQAVYFEARAGYEPRHLLTDVIRALPVATGEGWRLQTSAAVAYLREHPNVFLIDEAQRLNYACLDLLKYLADNSGSTCVLSASSSLATRIERWPDIASRCPVRLEVQPISLEEFVELWQVDGWSLEVLQEIHRVSKGIMRTIRYIFVVLEDSLRGDERHPSVPRAEVTPAHVRAVAQSVVPANIGGELVMGS